MKQITVIILIILAVTGFVVLKYGQEEVMYIDPPEVAAILPVVLPPLQAASSASSTQLKNPPDVVRAKYFTAWVAGSPKRMDAFMARAAKEEINAVVIDIKDYSGYVSYAMDIPAVKEAGADRQIRIRNMNALIQKLHAKNIYVIGRVTVFQDPVFAKAHPELSLFNAKTGEVWRDSSRLAWLDASGEPTWEYVVDIAKDAYARGFDEVNFDYVRFPSDGDLRAARYPFWDGSVPRHEVIRGFFAYLRENLPDQKISVDLFGQVTVNRDDMGIGQVLEDAFPYVDYIAPMIYPSHYGPGFLGFKTPAAHPYEVVAYSLEQAVARRNTMVLRTSSTIAQIRPWLQVFDMGAKYTPELVLAQIRATEDVLLDASAGDAYGGWMLWDPSTIYRSYNALY